MKSFIEKKNGKLLLNINGESFVPSAYMSYVNERADYEGVKRNGCRLFFNCLYMGDWLFSKDDYIWKSENEFDFTAFKKSIDKIIGNSKVGEIYVFLRVNLNAPTWWKEKYPEEVMENAEGVKWMQSPSSQRWLNDCEKFLLCLKKYIAENGYEEYIAGWHLAALATEEWYIPEAGRNIYDFSPTGIQAFQAYCQEKYQTIQALNGVWKKNYSDFSEISVPTFEERYSYSLFNQYKNTDTDAMGSDYFECCNAAVSNAIMRLCKTAKEILNHDLLIGAFYGYILQLPAWRGHSNLGKILRCPDVDFFASPFAYVNLRKGAHDWIYHSAMHSATAADKIWFLEADVRTHLTEPVPDCCPWLFEGETDKMKSRYYEPVWYGPDTEEQSKHHLTRSLGKVLASGHAFWWFDMWGGWYRSEGLTSHIQSLEKLYNASMLRGDKDASEMAFVIDEKTSMYATLSLYCKAFYDQTVVLGNIGAPCDFYLLEDIERVDFSKYKTILFAAPLHCTDGQSKAINALKNNGRSLLFTAIPDFYGKRTQGILGFDYGEESGVVEKEFDNHRVLWNKDEMFTAEQIRTALEKSGGHIYNKQGDIIYANEKYITWTAVAEGLRELKLPPNKSWRFAINAKEFTQVKDTIILSMKYDETVIIELE